MEDQKVEAHSAENLKAKTDSAPLVELNNEKLQKFAEEEQVPRNAKKKKKKVKKKRYHRRRKAFSSSSPLLFREFRVT